MGRSCSVCSHPQRQKAEELLRQGLSVRCTATEIGVGAAALHRHWSRHVGNRDTMVTFDAVARGNETAGSETLERAEPRPPESAERVVPSIHLLAVTRLAGGQPFCWCARCLGRQGHYAS
jgi:hypothetical protein